MGIHLLGMLFLFFMFALRALVSISVFVLPTQATESLLLDS